MKARVVVLGNNSVLRQYYAYHNGVQCCESFEHTARQKDVVKDATHWFTLYYVLLISVLIVLRRQIFLFFFDKREIEN